MWLCAVWFVLWSLYCAVCFFFKQKTAYEMRISDWSSDVCSSDLPRRFCPSAPPPRLDRLADRHRAGCGRHRTRRSIRLPSAAAQDGLAIGSNSYCRRPRSVLKSAAGNEIYFLPLGMIAHLLDAALRKIGRAPSRERVGKYV